MIEYFKKNEIKITKIDSGEDHNMALDINGNVYSWGISDWYQCGHTHNRPTLIGFFVEKGIVIGNIECDSGHSYCKSVNVLLI